METLFSKMAYVFNAIDSQPKDQTWPGLIPNINIASIASMELYEGMPGGRMPFISLN